MYTSAIEAVCAILNGLSDLRDAGVPDLYDTHFERYVSRLSDLFDGLDWYEGTYTLVSYSQTREWTVYGVDRATSPHTAIVEGIHNVYDDQQWLVRELLKAWKVTGESRYLEKAEYLASYVIDGWDCTLRPDGTEHGGITWGPGYYTKHSCSNGPFVSPLVWLSEIYSDSGEQVEYRYIGEGKKRLSTTMDKAGYYLMYARKVYEFQRSHLFNKSLGVYYDMLGAKGFNGDNIAYETVDGVTYRGNNEEKRATGEYYTYNTGTMLSGAADLYRVTGEKSYLDDMTATSSSAFVYFAKKSQDRDGCYDYPVSGFSNWFNGVLLRGWVDVAPFYSNVDLNVMSFQHNLDYAYEYNNNGDQLPPNLLQAWNTDRSKCRMEGMFEFAYAAEYANIARYLIDKQQ